MPYYTNCVNCGKQTNLEGNDLNEPCEFCGKPARIKEGSTEAAIKTEAPVVSKTPTEEVHSEEHAPLYVGKERTYQPGQHKWKKRCKECPLIYTHDEQPWCSSKKCPQRCPPRFRPQYRPNIEEKPTEAVEAPAGSVKRTEEFEEHRLLIKAHRAEIYRDLDEMPRREVELKWGLNHRTMGQLIKSRKDKGAAAGGESGLHTSGAEDYPLMKKARVEVQLAYYKGFHDCAELFLKKWVPNK